MNRPADGNNHRILLKKMDDGTRLEWDPVGLPVQRVWVEGKVVFDAEGKCAPPLAQSKTLGDT
jgi:hypothetical protein